MRNLIALVTSGQSRNGPSGPIMSLANCELR